jgi:hypothetical protein
MPFVVEVLKSHDSQPYTLPSGVKANPSANSTWQNILNAAGVLKLVKTSLVTIRAQITASHSENTNVCCQNSCVRISFVNSAGTRYSVGGYGWRTYNTTATYTYDFYGFAVLPAETYDIVIDISAYDYAHVTNVGVNLLYIGVVDIADLWKVANWSQTVTAAARSRVEFGAQTISPLARTTVIGPLKKAMLFVFIGVDGINWYGDGAASNFAGFQIAVDGVWINTPSAKFDGLSEDTAGFHWAQYWCLIDPNVSHTVKFRLSNGTSSSVTRTFHCGVIACPWIFPSDSYYDLIDIEVPVGSTIYGAVEDFFKAAQAKYAAIRSVNVQNGVQNVTEFSAAASASPLSFNYTPEWYETAITLAVKGWGNCLSRLACDLRG